MRAVLAIACCLLCCAARAADLGSWNIDDVVTFTASTYSPSGGDLTDADSVPTYRVYEDETATPILTGSMAAFDDDDTDGFYSEQVTLSAANGFEKGKSYTIRIFATVEGIQGATERTLQVGANVRLISGTGTGEINLSSGNLAGSVGSVTGAVGSVTGNVGGNVSGSVGSVTGAVGSVTGNVGGNVTGSVGSVTTGGITASSFAANAITSTVVADNTITANKIATDAITAAKIAADAIGASELAANAIAASEIASNAITSAKIATDAIGAAQLAADAIGSSEWAATATTEVQTGLATQTSVDTVDNVVDAILVDTAEIGTAGAGLTALASQASVNTIDGIVDDILTDTAAIPTFPTNFAALGINASGHVSRVTLADTITTYTGNTPQTGDSFARIGVNGSGLIAVNVSSMGGEDVATWVNGDIVDAVGTALGVYDPPTNAEMINRTLAAASYATSSAQTTAQTSLTTLEGRLTSSRAGYLDKLNVSGTLAHSDAASTYQADVSGVATAAALSTMQGNVTDILADTAELQGDWANGGRLDLIADAILADTAAIEPLVTTNLDAQVSEIEGGGGSISVADADMVAARVVAARGDYYPNRNVLFVLRFDSEGAIGVAHSHQISKPAGEDRVQWIDFAGVMGRNEAVQAIDAISVSGGGGVSIVTDSESIVGSLVRYTLTGGTSGEDAVVHVEVTTTADQEFEADVTTTVTD